MRYYPEPGSRALELNRRSTTPASNAGERSQPLPALTASWAARSGTATETSRTGSSYRGPLPQPMRPGPLDRVW